MEKGYRPPFLVPWPQIFSDLRAAVVWDSDGEGERGKRTKNVGINYCDGDVGCGLWELYSGMIQGYRDQRQDEGCPEMEKWRRRVKRRCKGGSLRVDLLPRKISGLRARLWRLTWEKERGRGQRGRSVKRLGHMHPCVSYRFL